MLNNKNFFKFFTYVSFMSLFFLMEGCISTITMTPEEAKSIKTIEVS